MNKTEQELLCESMINLEEAVAVKKVVSVLPARGNRNIVMHGSEGKEDHKMIGHIDHIPHVDIHSLEADPSKDRFHAYAKGYRADSHGISHPVYKRLGHFAHPDEAVAAIKKHHKIED